DTLLDSVKELIYAHQQPPGGGAEVVRFFAGTQNLYTRLKGLTDFVYDKGDKVQLFGEGLVDGVSVCVTADKEAKESFADRNITYFDVIEHLAETFDLFPTMDTSERLVLQQRTDGALRAQGCIIDLRSALRPGVNETELKEKIAAMIAESDSYAIGAAKFDQ